jgi:hypothetical protein
MEAAKRNEPLLQFNNLIPMRKEVEVARAVEPKMVRWLSLQELL